MHATECKDLTQTWIGDRSKRSVGCVLCGLCMFSKSPEELKEEKEEEEEVSPAPLDTSTEVAKLRAPYRVVDPTLYNNPNFVTFLLVILADFLAFTGVYIPYTHLPPLAMVNFTFQYGQIWPPYF